jgi:hypothetical protein
MVDFHRGNYFRSKRLDKNAITKEIVRNIKQEGARFLKRCGEAGEFWVQVSDTEAAHKVSHALRSKARRHCLQDTNNKDESVEAEKDSAASGIASLRRHNQQQGGGGGAGGMSGSGGRIATILPSGMSLPNMSPPTSTVPNSLQPSLSQQRRHPMLPLHSITSPLLDLRMQMETAAMLANRQGFALEQRLVPTAMTGQTLVSGSSLPLSWPSSGDRMTFSMQPRGGVPSMAHMLQMRHLQENALAQSDMLQQAFNLPLQHPGAGGHPFGSSMIATTMPPYLPGPATMTTTATTTRLPFTTMGGHPNHPLNWFNTGISMPSQESLGMAHREWEFSQLQQQHHAAATAAASSTNVRSPSSLNELRSTPTFNTTAERRPPGSWVPDNIGSGSRPR